ncbi:MAG: hypothetical protein PHH08_03300 [Candidatus ainarchaeum sp.]|nr:hypothetical protein [Candidatus ainarchaeum sp.]
MQIDKKTIIFAAVIAAAIIISAFLLNASGISVAQILDVKNYKVTIAKLLAAEFIGFVFIAPVSYAAAIIAMKKNESMETLAICSLSAAIAVIISLVAFPNLMHYLILALFAIASFPVAMYYSKIAFKELKKFATFRGTGSSINKGAMIIALGILVFSAATILPKNQQMATQMEYDFVELTIGENATGMAGLATSKISEQIADGIILQQSQTLDQMTGNQAFEKLRAKQDPDIIAFVTATDAIKQQIQSPVYRAQLIAQIAQNQESALQNAGINQSQIIQMIKKMPIIQQLEPFFWFMAALILIGISQILFLIISNLGAAYCLILDRAIPKEDNNQPATQN